MNESVLVWKTNGSLSAFFPFYVYRDFDSLRKEDIYDNNHKVSMPAVLSLDCFDLAFTNTWCLSLQDFKKSSEMEIKKEDRARHV